MKTKKLISFSNCLRTKPFNVFVALFLISFVPCSALVQDVPKPLTPPVDIAITASDNLQISQDITVTIRITPRKDMNLDADCLIPNGVMPVSQPDLRIMPYHMNGLNGMPAQPQYYFAIGLMRGPIKAGETKEFTFQVKAAQKGSYTFICLAQIPGKWGEKKESLTLNIK